MNGIEVRDDIERVLRGVGDAVVLDRVNGGREGEFGGVAPLNGTSRNGI